MGQFDEVTEKIKTLKNAREILQNEYEETDFHKKKEESQDDTVPSAPEDEEIFKLLTAISQIDIYIKKLQTVQFQILKDKE